MFLRILNILARIFSLLALLGGIVFLISAYAIPENRTIYSLAGILQIAIGAAFMWVKPVRKEDLSTGWRAVLGQPGTGGAETG